MKIPDSRRTVSRKLACILNGPRWPLTRWHPGAVSRLPDWTVDELKKRGVK